MSFTYFLGANSKDGFASLYSSFPAVENAKLHIIKGGPGCGKSSFMRTIGREAENRGMHAEYVLCSGDPDSLDGVYIRELNQAWVDGTAPHITEPTIFGLDADYIDLGQFVNLTESEAARSRLRKLNSAYKSHYQSAYSYLRAAAIIRYPALPPLLDKEQYQTVRKRIGGIISRAQKTRSVSLPAVRKCFLSANSCKGNLFLNSSIEELCKQIIEVDDRYKCASGVLELAAEEAGQLGLQVITAYSPLCPGRTEAVLIPERSLAFVTGGRGFEKSRHIRIDSLIAPELQRAFRRELKECAAIEASILSLAFDKLRQAKALHDELEREYRPYIDFGAEELFISDCVNRLHK